MINLILSILTYMAFLIVIYKQQCTIDRLTDKLMAKDYREYVQYNKPVANEEKPLRKPLSWHDDPNVEVEESQ